jgi:integrase
MAVWREKNGRTYRYEFYYRGEPYRGNTGQLTKSDAQAWERDEKRRVARVAGGLEAVAVASPLIQEWGDVYLAYQQQSPRVKRPDLIARALPMLWEFWGVAPRGVEPSADRPYHGLTLADPITDPTWVVRFEDWMKGRRRRLPRRASDPADAAVRLGGPISGSQRNTFRSVMSGLYRVALLPQYVKVSGVSAAAQAAGTPANPFAAVPRDRRRRRRLRLSLDDLRSWFEHSAFHLKIALAIGALAPTLRLGNILALRWHDDARPDATATVSKDFSELRVDEHKADDDGEPLVVPIVGQLRGVLELAWQHRTDRVGTRDLYSGYVVHYRGRRVKSLKTALRRAAARADVPYGTTAGSTFHTLRHFAASLLARKKVPEAQRQAALGHGDLATTQIYTHLAGLALVDPLTVLSEAVPLADLLVGAAPGDGPRRGKTGGTQRSRDRKDRGNLAVFPPSRPGPQKAREAS